MRIRRSVLWVLPFLALGLLLAVPHTRTSIRTWLDRVVPRGEAAARTSEAADDRAGDADQHEEDDSPSAVALPVTGRVIARGPFRLSVNATGRAESLHRVELSARVGERVTAVHAHEGESVAAGAPLIELDPRPFTIAVHQAEAQAARAEMEWKAALLGQPDANEETKTLLRHRAGLTTANEDLARASLDLEGATLRAPFAGVVSALRAQVGERVAPNQSLVTLVDLASLRVPAEVLESSFGAIRVGAEAKVRFPALGDRIFEGTVESLGPEIDPARGTGIAYVRLDNRERDIRPGMYAEIEIGGALLADRLVVPRSAVLERDRRLLVFRARGGRAEWSYVELGAGTEREVEVVSGIDSGDTVLTEGHMTLAHGAPIRVSLADAP